MNESDIFSEKEPVKYLSGSLTCDICKKIGFASPQSLSNHKGRCKKRKRLNVTVVPSQNPVFEQKPKRNRSDNGPKKILNIILENIHKINVTSGET